MSRRALAPVPRARQISKPGLTPCGSQDLVAPLSILRLTSVENCGLKIIFRIEEFHVATNCPRGSVNEYVVRLAKNASAVGLQLIPNSHSVVRLRGHDNVHMVRPWVRNPQMPASKLAQSSNLGRNHFPVRFTQQHDLMLQSIRMPFLKPWCRWLSSTATPAPPTLVTLKEGAIDRPRDESTQAGVVSTSRWASEPQGASPG